jgi:hypothetical protein
MPTFLDDQEDRVVEKSTALFELTFTDEEGVQIQDADITSLKWHLSDTDGNIINDLQNEVIGSPTNPQKILLRGDDLQILSTESGNVLRVLTIEGTYNSSNGSNLELNDECRFWVDNLAAVN